MKYDMHVELILDDIVEADTPEEAFQILSDCAISGGDWYWSYKEVEEE